MAYPDELLVSEERILIRQHPHWKVLTAPFFFALMLTAGVAADLRFGQPQWHAGQAGLIEAGVLAVLALVLVVVPIVSWRCELFVLSSLHLFTRRGILVRKAQQIPLSRLQDIETAQSVMDRILRCGDLLASAASDQPLTFRNIPHVQQLHQQINQLARASVGPDQ